MKEDSKGLYFESNPLYYHLPSDVETIQQDCKGTLGTVVNEEFSKEDNANIIKEIKLYEGSNVTLGANSNGSFWIQIINT